MKNPYNVSANFRIAFEYRNLEKLEEAKRYIKRIVIKPSTEKIIKDLYKELIKKDPKAEVKIEVFLTKL